MLALNIRPLLTAVISLREGFIARYVTLSSQLKPLTVLSLALDTAVC
jgi:hypothetical protein